MSLQPHLVTPCIWLGTTHPCNRPQYGLCINLHFFTICMYKHCSLPLSLVSVMKCCVKMYGYLPHNPYCCSLPSPVCLLHLLICTCLNSSPIACPPFSVLCWCLLCFFILFLFYTLLLCGCFFIFLIVNVIVFVCCVNDIWFLTLWLSTLSSLY